MTFSAKQGKELTFYYWNLPNVTLDYKILGTDFVDIYGMAHQEGDFIKHFKTRGTTKEIVHKTFDFIVAKFNRDAKTLELVPVTDDSDKTAADKPKDKDKAAAGKPDEAKPFVVTFFSEYEKFTLPDGRKFPLFYDGGGNMGMGGGEGMMMGAPGPGMNAPGRRMP